MGIFISLLALVWYQLLLVTRSIKEKMVGFFNWHGTNGTIATTILVSGT